MKNKNILYIVGSILSLISIVVVYYLCSSFNEVFNTSNLDKLSPKVVEEILSRTISSPRYIAQLTGSLIVIISSSIIAAYLLVKKVKGLDKAFAIFLLPFGGFGIPFIIFIIKLLRGTKVKGVNRKIIGKRTSIAVTSVSILAPIFALTTIGAVKGVDNPTTSGDVVFSLDKSKPNLVEIFTDGFDAKAMRDLLDAKKHPAIAKTFSGFTGLENFLTPGFITHVSIPAQISNDYEHVNPFMINYEMKKKGLTGSIASYAYENWFPLYAMGRLNGTNGSLNNSFVSSQGYNRHFINPTSMSDTSSFMPHVSGNPEWFSKTYDANDKNPVQIVNWGQAKHDNAGTFGVYGKNSDGQFYKWAEDHSSASASAKPEYLWLQDSLTHTPRNGGKDNSLEWNSSFNKYQKVVDNLADLTNKLKSIKAYDNSMIVIYGDHADHSRKTIVEGDVIRGNRSFAMVKYPNSHEDFKWNDTNAFFATDLNDIVSDYFNNFYNKGISMDSTHLESAQFGIDRSFRIFDGPLRTAKTKLVLSTDNSLSKNKFVHDNPDLKYEEVVDNSKGGWVTYDSLINGLALDKIPDAIEGLWK